MASATAELRALQQQVTDTLRRAEQAEAEAAARAIPQLNTTARLMYPVSEAWVLLGLSRATFYRLVRAGEIRLSKQGVKSFVARADLEEYVERLRNPDRATA